MATLALEEDEVGEELLGNFDESSNPYDFEIWGELLRTKSLDTADEGSKTELRADQRYVLGRDTNACQICIPDPHVSSKHCVIFRDDKQVVWVEDHSLSGTFVNGQRVAKKQKKRIVNGDTITLLHATQSAAAASAGKASSPTATMTKKPPSNFYEFVFRDLTPKRGPCQGEINKKYEVLEEIGSGSFATVRKGVNRKTLQEVAIKIVLRKQFEFEPSKWKDQLKEIDMLKRVDHHACVRLLDTYEVEDALYIVMEYVAGGELFDRILKHGKLEDEEARVLTRRLLEAVLYLHQVQRIVHRDLKPENILCVHNAANCLHIKVADFGVARLVDGNGCKTITGSLAYLAPEVFDRRDTVQGLGSYAYEVDMWSVGVIVYVCLLARLPFHNMERSQDLASAVRKMFSGNELDSLTEEARDFLRNLLTMESSKRLSAASALQHPWVANAAHCAKNETCQECAQCTTNNAATASKKQKMANSSAPPVPLFSQEM